MSDDDATSPDSPNEADDAALAALERVRARGRPAKAHRRAPGTAKRARTMDREPLPLGDLVEELAGARAWKADLEVGAIVGRWQEIVGPDIAEHCRPESFRDGELRLRTDSTAWAHQLRLLLPQLRARLEGVVGNGVIEQVRIEGPAAPSWKHGMRTVKGRGPRDTYG